MADELLHIDGSQGEGGGQILRSALALSIVTGKPFRIEKVRAGRKKPGLLRQHLTCVRAAARVCDGGMEGGELGSTALTFFPGAVKPGQYRFAVGSAGSTLLVVQTVLPPLLLAGGASTVTVEGGTHNMMAPPFDFFDRCFLPLLRRMGADVTATLDRPGYYPAGGGSVTVNISPAPLRPMHLPARGEIVRRTVRADVAGLPAEIAVREAARVLRMMNWPPECREIREIPDAFGPGNYLAVEIESEHVTELFSGFGSRGTRAEAVAETAIQEAKAYLASGAPVGPHLADQLLLPMALAGGGSFTSMPLSLHVTTNAAVIGTFLPVEVRPTPTDGRNVRVEVVAEARAAPPKQAGV